MTSNIILMGPKHSGKTNAGRALASLCSCEFIDLDELISQTTGKTPRQLYIESPVIFQKAEADAVAAIINSDAQYSVIATGGGIIDNSEAVALLPKINAVTVYLNISAENAWQRITNSIDGELPPFLQTENPQETHRVLHERRAAAYSQFAKIVIEAEDKSSKEIAVMIIESMKGFS